MTTAVEVEVKERRMGRPLRDDIDMGLVHVLMPSFSLRKIADRIGVPQSTLSYRLRCAEGEPECSPNPFCLIDRRRMLLKHETRSVAYYYSCAVCGATTRNPRPVKVKRHVRGRPPKEFDHETVSEMIKSHSVADVAAQFGMHRNTIYRYIECGKIAARPFRTWILGSATVITRSSADGLAYWPYMTADDPRYNGLIRGVNEAVPRTLCDGVRADVCQEIMVSVLTGEIDETEIASAVRSHLKNHYKKYPVKAYGVLSLDAPLYSDRDLRLVDTLDAERVAERIRDAIEANRFTEQKPRRAKHFSRPRRVVEPDIRMREYDRLRRTYQFLRDGRVVTSAFKESENFGGAWTVETALPDELGYHV